MGFLTLSWLFVLAVAVHNLEEAIWLPSWSRTAGHWHRPVGALQFRFAVIVLTVLAGLVALLSTIQGESGIGSYLVCGYALAMLLNVAFPHVLATLVLWRYMPGTATAVLFNLPVTVLLLKQALLGGYIELSWFLVTGPVIVITIAASIPLLFRIGREIYGST